VGAPDPEIEELERQRTMLKGGSYRIKGRDNEEEIRRLTNKIRTKRAERDNKIISEYREYYFQNRPTWDIERQVTGEEEEGYVAPLSSSTSSSIDRTCKCYYRRLVRAAAA
jgi:hypothetical protein